MKKTKLISLVLLVALVLSNMSFAFATNKVDRDIKVERINEQNGNEKVSVIVELEASPIYKLIGYATKTLESISSFKQNLVRQKLIRGQKEIQSKILEKINPNAKFDFSYTSTLNGFQADVLVKDLNKIRQLSGVKEVYLDQVFDEPEPLMASSGEMVNAPTSWNVGIKGEGTVVSVIDTGIDVDHELMVLSNNNTAKMDKNDVSFIAPFLNATELCEDANEDTLYKTAKIPYAFDYADKDTDPAANSSEHGVHVAGTIAANNVNVPDKFNGIAPEAQVIVMKVFSDNDAGAKTSTVIAAMEDSILLGVDSMNLSLGSPAGFTCLEGYSEYDYSQTVSIAKFLGINVVIAAGNEDRIGEGSNYGAPTNDYTDYGIVGSPSTATDCTSVASAENTVMQTTYILHPSTNARLRYSDISERTEGSTNTFLGVLNNQTVEYVECGLGYPADFEGKDLTGKIALVQRGTITFTEKITNALNSGAVAAIVYDNVYSSSLINMQGSDTLAIPSCFIGRADGEALIAAETKTLYMSTDNFGEVLNPSAGLMSSFTSWGCTPDLKFKPEITAPGGQIYSTVTDGYATMSGTSMASPHVAGGTALVRQYVSEDAKFFFTPFFDKADIVEKLLMSTSAILTDEYGYQYSPRRQGSGMMDVAGAINTEVYATNEATGKTKIELGDNVGDTYNLSFTLKNISSQARTYRLRGSALSDYTNGQVILPVAYTLGCEMSYNNAPIDVVAMDENGESTVIENENLITVNPYSTKTIEISVTLDSDTVAQFSQMFQNGFFVEGFIEMVAQDEGEPNLSIPYMGYHGNWDDAANMDTFLLYDGQSYYFNYSNYYMGGFAFSPSSMNILGIDNNGRTAYDFITITPNGDADRDDIAMNVALLRNCRNVKAYIKNANDEVVRSLVDEDYMRKESYDATNGIVSSTWFDQMGGTWDGKNDNGELVADGQYYYVIESVIDYEGATPQIVTVPVFVDTMAPTLVNSTITEEEGKKLLTVTLNDNDTFGVVAFVNENGEVIYQNTLEVMDNNTQTITVDVTGLNSVTLVCEDLGGNAFTHVFDFTPAE